MSSPRKRGLIVAALGASAIAGAALTAAPVHAVSAEDVVPVVATDETDDDG